jgi:hypothetical protein
VEEKEVRTFCQARPACEDRKGEFAGIEVDYFRIVEDGPESDALWAAPADADSHPVNEDAL